MRLTATSYPRFSHYCADNSITLNTNNVLIETGFRIDLDPIYLTGEIVSGNIGSIVDSTEMNLTYQFPADTIRIFYTETVVIH